MAVQWWQRLDASAKGILTLGAFAAIVAASTRSCDRVVSAAQLKDAFARQEGIDEKQDEDLDLLFETQVRLVTSVENLQSEVREVRKDLRSLDAGRPLPPLRAPAEVTPTP